MKNTSQAELKALIERSLKAQAEQKRAEKDRVVAAFEAGEIPTSAYIARLVTWRVGREREAINAHSKLTPTTIVRK